MDDKNIESFSLRSLFLLFSLSHLLYPSWWGWEASQPSQSLSSKERFLDSPFSLRFRIILAVWKKAKRLWATSASLQAVIAPACLARKAPSWIRGYTHLLLVITAFSGQAEWQMVLFVRPLPNPIHISFRDRRLYDYFTQRTSLSLPWNSYLIYLPVTLSSLKARTFFFPQIYNC